MTLKPFTENDQFFTDEKTIYYQNYGMKTPKPIPEVDADTFEVTSNVLARDKNKVYAISTMGEGLQIFEPEDIDSLVFITRNYFADNYNLYCYYHHFIEYCNIADKNTHVVRVVKLLKKRYPKQNAWWNLSDAFYKQLKPVKHNICTNGEAIFYAFKAEEYYDYPNYNRRYDDFFLQLKDAHADSFEVLNTMYSKDKNGVYFYSRQIPADANTFEIIDDLFARDTHGIWYNGRLAPIMDINSFEVVTKSLEKKEFHFCKDSSNVYSAIQSKMKFGGYANLLVELKNADPETFQEINDVWAKDKNNVYWLGKIYKKADAATFEQISESPLTQFDYAKDKNYVYIDRGQTLKKGLDGKSFIILNSYWAKDDFVVYSISSEKIMKNIDHETFRIIDENGKAEDKNYTYEFDYNGLKKKAK